MKFVDEVTIDVQAGDGGSGCLSFRRTGHYARGGPDGGNGGSGGDVVLVCDPALNTLVDLQNTPLLRGEPGGRGGSNLKTGASASPLNVPVPPGTTAVDDETLTIVGDISTAQPSLCIASGGAPGRGNASFKSSTNRSPRQTTGGGVGERRRLRLQLKLVADVGLFGLPNAGKSTMIRRVSASRAKVADYPFTTLVPNLGVVRLDMDRSFVIADVPGLVKGAADGVGLGTRFLRHLSRTRVLLHLVDIARIDGSDPVQDLKEVEDELYRYSDVFSERPIWTVATKIDALQKDARSEIEQELRAVRPQRPLYMISSATGEGVSDLIASLGRYVLDEKSQLDSDVEKQMDEIQRQRRFANDVLNRALEERRRRQTKSSASDDGPEIIHTHE